MTLPSSQATATSPTSRWRGAAYKAALRNAGSLLGLLQEEPAAGSDRPWEKTETR